MKLYELIENINPIAIIGDENRNISSICFDSRMAIDNSLYIAQKGSVTDGHNFIDQSISLGATAIVCEQLPNNILKGITYIQVQNSSESLGQIASAFYNNPSEEISLIGITGTNGKTTSVTLLHNLFTAMNIPCGMLSTVENRINNTVLPSTHTTPDAISLNKMLRQMVDQGCEYCFMEVSSHALSQHRTAGLCFKGAIFSNLTHDHIDYHKTFEAYLKTKKSFFDTLPKSAFALTNIDDKNGNVMLQNSKAQKFTYSLKSLADFKCKTIENSFEGLHLIIDEQEVWFNIVGEFNAYNLLSAYATARLLGFDTIEILEKLSNLKTAEGRFEYIANPKNIVAIVDYAHTPDALQNVLKTISEIRTGNEKIITVIGCGGNRDAEKRPIMARIANDYSDITILTSDNPRFEDPNEILKQMEEGIPSHTNKQYLKIEQRREAIKTACMLAQKGDVVLVAGKGHEKYQEINGTKFHFDDKEELINLLTKI